MTLDEYLIDELNEDDYAPPYESFWVQAVLASLSLLGPDTDAPLERFCKEIHNHYTVGDVSEDTIENIPVKIRQIRGAGYWNDKSILGLKYRCLNAITASRRKSQPGLAEWEYEADRQYGFVTAFQTINLDHKKDAVLLERIQKGLSECRPPAR